MKPIITNEEWGNMLDIGSKMDAFLEKLSKCEPTSDRTKIFSNNFIGVRVWLTNGDEFIFVEFTKFNGDDDITGKVLRIEDSSYPPGMEIKFKFENILAFCK